MRLTLFQLSEEATFEVQCPQEYEVVLKVIVLPSKWVSELVGPVHGCCSQRTRCSRIAQRTPFSGPYFREDSEILRPAQCAFHGGLDLRGRLLLF